MRSIENEMRHTVDHEGHENKWKEWEEDDLDENKIRMRNRIRVKQKWKDEVKSIGEWD